MRPDPPDTVSSELEELKERGDAALATTRTIIEEMLDQAEAIRQQSDHPGRRFRRAR